MSGSLATLSGELTHWSATMPRNLPGVNNGTRSLRARVRSFFGHTTTAMTMESFKMLHLRIDVTCDDYTEEEVERYDSFKRSLVRARKIVSRGVYIPLLADMID
jgi:hypothetical protein